MIITFGWLLISIFLIVCFGLILWLLIEFLKDPGSFLPIIMITIWPILALVAFGPDHIQRTKNLVTDTHVFRKIDGSTLTIKGPIVAYTGSHTVFRLNSGKYVVTNFGPDICNLSAFDEIVQVWTCKSKVTQPDETEKWRSFI
jgi:hypothetical protein